MSKTIYQKINWKNYNKFWEKNFTNNILEIKKYFENKNDKYKKLNLVFYKSYFFFSVSQIIFFDYLEKKRLFKHYEKKTLKYLLNKLFKKRSIEYKFLKKKKLNYQNKIINFKFFLDTSNLKKNLLNLNILKILILKIIEKLALKKLIIILMINFHLKFPQI